MLYNNAPIVEAIFDIRVDSTEISDVSTIEPLKETVLKNYPISNKRVNFQGKIELNSKTTQVSTGGSSNVLGYIFSNKEENRKIQFRLDGFTFNFLKPYTNWEEFASESLKFWNHYRDFAKPNIISRIALRYVNRIELPLEGLDFDDYFKNIPKIPDFLPQVFNNFYLQMNVPCDIPDTNVTLRQTFEQPQSNFLPYILDIDVYKATLMSLNTDLGDEFLKLRELKNKIFESLITDKTRELFN